MVSRIFHSLGDQVFETIKELIVNNTYLPGETLQIDKLAAEFGVSTTPVREALLRLEGSGLVDIERNKGAVVTRISEESSAHVWEFRRILEAAVARDAAAGCTEREIDALEQILNDLDRNPNDFTAYRKSDIAVHALLASHTKNPLLLDSLDNLSTQAHRIRYFAEKGPFREDVIQEVTAEHHQIVAALRTHDPDATEAAVVRHLTNAERRTRAALASTR